MNLEFIVGSTVTLVALLIGFYIGRGKSPITEDTAKKIKRVLDILPIKKDLGAIPRPTAQDIEMFNNPLKKAEEEVMSKTFSEIVNKT